MKIFIGFCFILSIASVCFAGQTEILNVTTYYPSAKGIYDTVRLYPTNQTPDMNVNGTLFYNSTSNEIYLYSSDSWAPLGAGPGMKVQSNSTVYPDACDGTKFLIPYSGKNYELCSSIWYKNITFSPAFTSNASKPTVFVSAQRVSGRNATSTGGDPVNNTCSLHGTRKLVAYADAVTNTSFKLFASGTVEWGFASDSYDCEYICSGNSTAINKIRTYYVKAEAQWMAIGQ